MGTCDDEAAICLQRAGQAKQARVQAVTLSSSFRATVLQTNLRIFSEFMNPHHSYNICPRNTQIVVAPMQVDQAPHRDEAMFVSGRRALGVVDEPGPLHGDEVKRIKVAINNQRACRQGVQRVNITLLTIVSKRNPTILEWRASCLCSLHLSSTRSSTQRALHTTYTLIEPTPT